MNTNDLLPDQLYQHAIAARQRMIQLKEAKRAESIKFYVGFLLKTLSEKVLNWDGVGYITGIEVDGDSSISNEVCRLAQEQLGDKFTVRPCWSGTEKHFPVAVYLAEDLKGSK